MEADGWTRSFSIERRRCPTSRACAPSEAPETIRKETTARRYRQYHDQTDAAHRGRRSRASSSTRGSNAIASTIATSISVMSVASFKIAQSTGRRRTGSCRWLRRDLQGPPRRLGVALGVGRKAGGFSSATNRECARGAPSTRRLPRTASGGGAVMAVGKEPLVSRVPGLCR